MGATAASTYYVDYAGGENTADGLTPATAWKHSPGDANATDGPAEAVLQPGDTIRFKGGVTYLGSIRLETSGEEGKPITFDGNTDGSFGEGRAVLDGATLIRNWQAVASPEQVGDNPNWREMVFADLPVDLSSNFNTGDFVLHREQKPARQPPWQRLFLIDGDERLLPIAQHPKPEDTFFHDLPKFFLESPHALELDSPVAISYDPGTMGNRHVPIIGLLTGDSAVIQPVNGGSVTIEFREESALTAVGITLFRPATHPGPERVVILADGREVLQATPDFAESGMQRFDFPEAVRARKLTFRLQHAEPTPAWVRLQQIAAFDAEGNNLLDRPAFTLLRDEENLKAEDPEFYTGTFVGVHGGNNHVYFARALGFDPETHRLRLPLFMANTYPTTRHMLLNHPRLITEAGEWSVEERPNRVSRVYMKVEGGLEAVSRNIGYPALPVALTVSGASHVHIRGFLIQRFSGARNGGGVVTTSNREVRSAHVRVEDCEIRFVGGHAGISFNHSDHVTAERNHIHHCPGWTVGIYVNRVNHFRLGHNRLVRNSGSGIRHYEATRGHLHDNQVLGHFGMHSSGINLYEGCADIVFERNHVEKSLVVNRSAKNFTIRNNLFDGLKQSNYAIAFWTSGRTGDRKIDNILIEHNTFVNTDVESAWSCSIWGMEGASPITGLVVRNNILERLGGALPGEIRHNLFLRPRAEENLPGEQNRTAPDLQAVFRDPAKGDFRLRGDSPAVGMGVPGDVEVDLPGNRRDPKRVDVGAFSLED